MIKTSTAIIGVLAVFAIFALSNVAVDRLRSDTKVRISNEIASPSNKKVAREIPKTRPQDSPLSVEAIPVPENVSTIKSRSFIDRLMGRYPTFVPIPDPEIVPDDFKRAVLSALSLFDVKDTLSPDQVRFGGPAVIQRLKDGAVALLSPKILAVYKNTEAGGTGIGGNLFSQEAFTGPFTQTECGVGFYEVVEVGGVEYCDVIRYDFYDDDLEKSIAIALSVTEEQYCDAECTQPACKAVCEAVGDLTTAYLWDEAEGICGCGEPVYKASCVDTNDDGFGDACVQVPDPDGDGQSTCATDADCTQTFRGCLDGACVELRGSPSDFRDGLDAPGIAQCDTDLECLPEEEREFHSTCLGNQCVQVPEPGEDECGAAAPWALPCEDQCILETVTVTNPDGTTREEEICERPSLKYACLDNDILHHVAEPELQEILWSESEPWGEPVGPQCALVRCIDEDNSGHIEPDECTNGCLGINGLPDDGQCGYESNGPTDLSSTESLVDLPWVIDGSEFDPPALPELYTGGGGGTIICGPSSCDSALLAQQILDLEGSGAITFTQSITRTTFERVSRGELAPTNDPDQPSLPDTPLNPLLLQAIINASGVVVPYIGSVASGHHQHNPPSAHFSGDAADLWTASYSSCAQTEALFKYLYDNREALQIRSLIHFFGTGNGRVPRVFKDGTWRGDGKTGTTCTRPPGTTNLAGGGVGNLTTLGHERHIHVSVDPNGACASSNICTTPTGINPIPGLPASGPINAGGDGIVIENLSVSNPDGDCIVIEGASNVTIRNLNVGPCGGKAIYVLDSSNVNISNIVFINAGRNFVQFDKVQGGSVIGIAGANQLGGSNAEDLINMYMSNGTPGNPILISNNLLMNGGPSDSGSGIMLGDGGGSWQIAQSNVLINPGQVGIGVASGNNIVVADNTVTSASYPWTNTGIYAWNQYSDACYAISVFGNTVEWYNAAGGRNDYWDGGNCGATGI